ncbi:MAG: phosphoribosylglycinamide formyltransferase [Cyclobacteriaceae bacterium]
MQSKINIAIFASGNGSNADAIIRYFKNSSLAEVTLVLSNNANAYVLERALNFEIPAIAFNRSEFYEDDAIDNLLKNCQVGFIVLAGFMWLFPKKLVEAFPGRIVNIHPALLPKYGGKGMFGHHVHAEVIKNQEKESGITIHYVNENYDEGSIIFQARCEVKNDDTPESLAERIHHLEHKYYPEIIFQCVQHLSQ